MTTEERLKFEAMEQGVERIGKDVELIKLALLGNPMEGSQGLVGENRKTSLRLELLDAEVKVLRDERVRNGVYIKIITWLLAVISTIVIGFIINTTLNNNRLSQQQTPIIQIPKTK